MLGTIKDQGNSLTRPDQTILLNSDMRIVGGTPPEPIIVYIYDVIIASISWLTSILRLPKSLNRPNVCHNLAKYPFLYL